MITEENLEIGVEQIKEKAIEHVSTIERKRHSLPVVKLAELEKEILNAIAQGRTRKEIEAAMNLHGLEYCSYTSKASSLMRKFEAFTLAHTIYKAMKAGLVK